MLGATLDLLIPSAHASEFTPEEYNQLHGYTDRQHEVRYAPLELAVPKTPKPLLWQAPQVAPHEPENHQSFMQQWDDLIDQSSGGYYENSVGPTMVAGSLYQIGAQVAHGLGGMARFARDAYLSSDGDLRLLAPEAHQAARNPELSLWSGSPSAFERLELSAHRLSVAELDRSYAQQQGMDNTPFSSSVAPRVELSGSVLRLHPGVQQSRSRVLQLGDPIPEYSSDAILLQSPESTALMFSIAARVAFEFSRGVGSILSSFDRAEANIDALLAGDVDAGERFVNSGLALRQFIEAPIAVVGRSVGQAIRNDWQEHLQQAQADYIAERPWVAGWHSGKPVSDMVGLGLVSYGAGRTVLYSATRAVQSATPLARLAARSATTVPLGEVTSTELYHMQRIQAAVGGRRIPFVDTPAKAGAISRSPITPAFNQFRAEERIIRPMIEREHYLLQTAKPPKPLADVPGPRSLSGIETRRWYIKQDNSLESRISLEVSLETKGVQMCHLRNEIRAIARDLMADRLALKELKLYPPKTYEKILRKGYRKGTHSQEELSQYVIESAKRTSEKYNKRYNIHQQKHTPTLNPKGKKP